MDVDKAKQQIKQIQQEVEQVKAGKQPFETAPKSLAPTTSAKFDEKQDKKWMAYKRKMEKQTGENFDALAEQRSNPKDVTNDVLMMMGELEPTLPNSRWEQQKNKRVDA
jgi:hypothetical protein